MLSDWWNGVELWILGLPFPFQFALVVVVLGPVCLVVAWAIDRVVDHASAIFGSGSSLEPPISSGKHAAAAPEAEPAGESESAPESTEEPATERVPAESAGR
jgi:hypothetical protein